MSCSSMSYEAMAEQGWSDQQIDLLKKEVELARQEAKVRSFNKGMTLRQQELAIENAELKARKVAHDRFHAELDEMMAQIVHLRAMKKVNV